MCAACEGRTGRALLLGAPSMEKDAEKKGRSGEIPFGSSFLCVQSLARGSKAFILHVLLLFLLQIVYIVVSPQIFTAIVSRVLKRDTTTSAIHIYSHDLWPPPQH